MPFLTGSDGRIKYVPSVPLGSGNTDIPRNIVKRLKAAEKLRSILYVMGDETMPAPLDVRGAKDYVTGEPLSPSVARAKRMNMWAFCIRNFTARHAVFHYWEIFDVARRMSRREGKPMSCTLSADAALLNRFENELRSYRSEIDRAYLESNETPLAKEVRRQRNRIAEALLHGLCPFCASALPCHRCEMPVHRTDGHGGFIPVEESLEPGWKPNVRREVVQCRAG